MIKLIDYKPYGTKEVFISKTMIQSIENVDGMTSIFMSGGVRYTVKETPEEILAMPDIEEGNKVIDWEQRRYEIAKHILSQTFIIRSPKVSAIDAVWYADALIEELKEVRND